jgi:hypothetical protein
MSKVGPKKSQQVHEEEKNYQDDAQFPFRQSRRRIVDENDSPTRELISKFKDINKEMTQQRVSEKPSNEEMKEVHSYKS